MIDTHAHLDDHAYDKDRQQIIDNFEKDGIDFVINNSCDVEEMTAGFLLAQKYDKIYCTVGMHPYYPEKFTPKFVADMEEYAKSPKVVAVGEIGLDYHLPCDKEAQKQMFSAQLQIADKLGLPVTLHIRDAYQDALDVLTENKQYLNKPVVWHCYSGSAEFAKQLVKMGHYFSFGGAITFKNAKKEEVLLAIPTDRIMSETDCPYMAPTPFRGPRNEPKMTKLVIEKMAQVYQLSFEEMEKILYQNTLKVFDRIKR